MKQVFCTAAALCLVLCGCHTETPPAPEPQGTTEPASGEELRQTAKTVPELAAQMKLSAGYPLYSGYNGESDFLMYFDLLAMNWGSDYFIVNEDGTDWLLYLYRYEDYGAVVKSITDIQKKYNGDTLELNVEKEIRRTNNEGCEPDVSYVRCIIPLEKPVITVTGDGNTLAPFRGGRFRIGDYFGIADAGLNIILPAIYRNAFPKLPGYGAEIPTMYRLITDDGIGLADENYNIILPPEYGSVAYLSQDRYVVTVREGGLNDLKHSRLCVVDGGGNVLTGYVDGVLFGDSNFMNYAKQAVFGIPHDPKPVTYGVVSGDMEVIIPAEYRNITVWNEDSATQFYVVENQKEQFAVFGTDGGQKTDWEKSSVYDVQTAYRAYLEQEG